MPEAKKKCNYCAEIDRSGFTKKADGYVHKTTTGLFYANIVSPEDGCGEKRSTLRVATEEIAKRHATDWGDAHGILIRW